MAAGDIIIEGGKITPEILQQITAEVVKNIQTTAKDPGQYEEVSSLQGVTSLPVFQVSGSVFKLVRVAVSILKGMDGKEIHLQSTATHLQWRWTDGMWTNLIAWADLKGDTGETPVFRTGASGIEWKYQGEPDTAWKVLVSYNVLKLKFTDLTPVQIAEFWRQVPADVVALFQQPATEAAAEVRDAMAQIVQDVSQVIGATNTAKSGAETATANAITATTASVTATSLATDATNAANTAASLAADAAVLAGNKAEQANIAAGNANTATSAADAAASAATVATGLANTATDSANAVISETNTVKEAAETATAATIKATSDTVAAAELATSAGTAAETATGPAVSAAVLAGEKAALANTAAGNADAAAGLATDAAALAGEKAELANTAAGVADAATGKANTATSSADTATKRANDAAAAAEGVVSGVRPDWEVDDPTLSSYIANKPDIPGWALESDAPDSFPEAPQDNKTYGRKDGVWSEVNSAGNMDGGTAYSVYGGSMVIDGGNAND